MSKAISNPHIVHKDPVTDLMSTTHTVSKAISSTHIVHKDPITYLMRMTHTVNKAISNPHIVHTDPVTYLMSMTHAMSAPHTMRRAIQDPEVCHIIRDCIAIVACYVPPTMMLELLVPRIVDGCEELRSRAAGVEVLAHVVR